MEKAKIDKRSEKMISNINATKGLGYAIKVQKMYDMYRSFKGFSRYDAVFAAVESQEVSIGVKQKDAEKITKHILQSAGIYPWYAFFVRLHCKYYASGIKEEVF